MTDSRGSERALSELWMFRAERRDRHVVPLPVRLPAVLALAGFADAGAAPGALEAEMVVPRPRRRCLARHDLRDALVRDPGDSCDVPVRSALGGDTADLAFADEARVVVEGLRFAGEEVGGLEVGDLLVGERHGLRLRSDVGGDVADEVVDDRLLFLLHARVPQADVPLASDLHGALGGGVEAGLLFGGALTHDRSMSTALDNVKGSRQTCGGDPAP